MVFNPGWKLAALLIQQSLAFDRFDKNNEVIIRKVKKSDSNSKIFQTT